MVQSSRLGAIARVHPVHLMNRHRVAANPRTKSNNSGCESAEKWLLTSAFTIAICYY